MKITGRLMANLDTIQVNGKNRDLSDAHFRELVNEMILDLRNALKAEAMAFHHIPHEDLPNKFYGMYQLIDEQERRKMESEMAELEDKVRNIRLKLLNDR